MAGLPSLGDIMLLSQLAWKIGCAFTSGRQGAPAEFQEVENELTSLTKAITLLTEVLDRDDSILARADEKTKDGLDKILECCRQTLENLNALIEQYQEVRKPEGTGSIAVQRVWKQIFIRNYKKIWWTAEGGNIQALRNMLQMHVSSISLTMQALQSKSLTRLENTIEPMADRVAGIHDKFNGDLDIKIAEIHQIMQGMAVDDPPPPWKDNVASSELWSQGLKKKGIGSNTNSTYNSDHIDLDQYHFPPTPGGRSPIMSGTERFSQRSSKAPSTEGTGRELEGRRTSPAERPRLPSGGLSPVLPGSELSPRSSKPSSREGTGRDTEGRRPPSPAERPRLPSVSEASPRYANDWRETAFADSDGRRLRSNNPFAQSVALTNTSQSTTARVSPVPSFGISQSASDSTPATSLFPSTTPYANSAAPSHGVSSSNIPQIPPRSSQRPSVTNMPYATSRTSNGTAAAQRASGVTTSSYPVSLSDSSQRMSQSSSYYETSSPNSMLPSPVIPPFPEAQPLHSNSLISPFPPVQEDPIEQRSSFRIATNDEHALFVRELTRDSATLCESVATLVEYTAPDPENPGELKMIEAASTCKISVITRMQNYANGSRFVTSIWTISDDKKVRMQQKLPDGAQIYPYTIWGNDLKVVLRSNTELKYHDVSPNSIPLDVVKTGWVNYIFADETGSAHFQSVIMGKTLILTLKTKRTLRVHDGLTGTFAFQEQLCGLENIRLWQDDNGDVLAMIHYSPQFRDGYLAFHVGFSSRKRIYFRGDGERHVKIKGLDVPIDPKKEAVHREVSPEGGKSPKAKAEKEKKITAVKIEFTTEFDKRTFLNKLKEVQG